MFGGGPNALRTVAIAISTLVGLALLFGLLFIQVRDAGLVHMRQLNYGELERVQHQLRDWADVLRVRVDANSDASNTEPRPKPVEQPYAIDDFPVDAVPADRPGWCSRLVGDAKTGAARLVLEFDGTQRRDDRVMLAYGLAKAADTACSRTNMSPILSGGDSRFSPDDLAVVRNDGRVLLVLRGEAAWPANTTMPIAASGAEEDRTVRPGSPLVEPVAIEFGGASFDLYAVPLDLGRSIRLGGADGVDCAPRECMLVALGQRSGVSESLRDLSPIVRTSFAALTVLVLLLIPLLKLRTIDQNGSINWIEVAALIASVPLAITALTLLLATHGDWVWQRLKQDAVADAHGRQLATEINAEVTVSLRNAVELAPCLKTIRPQDNLGFDLRCNLTEQVLPLRSLGVRALYDSRLVPGRVIKLSDFDVVPSVEDRDYFRRLKSETDLLPLQGLPGLKDAPPDPAARDSMSVATWKYTVAQVPDLYQNKSLMVAGVKPDPKYCNDVAKQDCFLLGAKTLTSTLQRPMPPGFGFAVIDPTTFEVLQHSDPTQQHSQSFDDQITRTARLDVLARAMPVQCGGNAAGNPPEATPSAEVLYRGETVRMTLTPACVPRWIVATWYSRTHEQRAVTLAARFAGGFALLILMAVGLLALVGGKLSRDRLIATIWPTPEVLTATGVFSESGHANRDLQTGLPVLAAYLAALLWFLGGDARLWLAFVIVILTAMAFYRAYYRGPPPELKVAGTGGWKALFRGRWAFVSGLVASLTVAVVACAWAGGWELTIFAFLVGGLLAWHLRAVGRWVGSILSLLREHFRRKAERAAQAKSAAPPARPVEGIAQRTRAVRMVQLWAMVLLAVLAPLAAYGAAADATQDAAARRYASEATLAHTGAWLEVSSALAHYCPAVGSKVCDATSPQAASKGPALTFWPTLPARDLSMSQRAKTRDWENFNAVEAIFRQVTSPDEFADFSAPHFDEPARPALGVEVAVAQTPTPAINFAFALMLGVMLLIALALGGSILGLLRMLNHGLFGLHHFEFRSLHPPLAAASLTKALDAIGLRRVLFIDFPFRDYDALCAELDSDNGYEPLHLGQLRDEIEDRPSETFGRKPWVIRGFESIISNGDMRRRALHLLERLASQKEVEIYFFSEMLPMERIKHQREREKYERREAGEQARNFESEAYRWAELFEGFANFRHEEQRPPAELLNSEVIEKQAILDIGFWQHDLGTQANLINDELLAVPSSRVWRQRLTFPMPTQNVPLGPPRPIAAIPVREQINEYLANFLGDYYQSQWVRSSKEEHLVMYHLAHGRFVNADNFSVINNLLTRGLVRREPDFRLMNRSFEHWIRTLEQPRWFERYRAEVEHGGAWNALRIPVLLLAIAGVIAAAYLDQGMSGSLLTMVPAIAAAVPLLIGRIAQTRKELG